MARVVPDLSDRGTEGLFMRRSVAEKGAHLAAE
jgi:hypothetical protein